MPFQRTTATNKVLALTKRKKVIRGGSSASKTVSILAVLIDKCCKNPDLEVSIISESVPHLKKGALKDFIKIMKWTKRWNENNYNATDRKYTFHNGAYMEFFSPESILGARRNILYINEANNISHADYMQLAMRTSHDIYLDYNPVGEFWADTDVLNEPNSELLILTYKDNEARPQNVDEEFAIYRSKAEAEKAQGLPINSFYQNYCRVYIDGEIGSLQGVVFNNWSQIKEVPLGAQLLGVGMDFGFSNDPTTAVKVFRLDGNLYCDELVYETQLLNSQLIDRLKSNGVTQQMEIIADSADPKTIAELRAAGFRCNGAEKGPDSIRSGIAKMQDKHIYVTERSTNLIKELRNYRWKVDKAGKSENEPSDAYNHAIDAIRYVVLNKLNKGSGVYHFV